jgi:hypothetical protein
MKSDFDVIPLSLFGQTLDAVFDDKYFTDPERISKVMEHEYI